MRYFRFLSEARQHDLFFKRPGAMHTLTPRHVLAHALGATLYMPGTRQDIADIRCHRNMKRFALLSFAWRMPSVIKKWIWPNRI
ncbi:hypothetical protein ACEQPO_01555 [Bacillus sp. SL00103]